MNLDEKVMKKILKEEYEKRINYFLSEKITIKDKRGENIIKNALGLKVYDKAGFRYTFGGIVKKEDGSEYAKLFLPEEPVGNEKGSGASPLFEEDFNDVRGFISRKPLKGKREIEFDAESPSAFSSYGEDKSRFGQSNLLDTGNEKDRVESSSKESKYILVPMGEFEERFSIN